MTEQNVHVAGHWMNNTAEAAPTNHATTELVNSILGSDPSRYGGVDGSAACDCVLTAVVDDIRALADESRSRRRRSDIAADLLLAAAWSSSGEGNHAVSWLRGYARSWAPYDPLGVDDLARARADAETAYVRNQADWLARPERLRDALGGYGSAVGKWHRMLAGCGAELSRLARDGRLDARPEQVVQRLVHAVIHGQLGLELIDEASLAWLVSLPLALARPFEPFFTDGATAVDRIMHEHTKYFAFHGDDQMPDQSLTADQGRVDLGPVLTRIPLPPAAGPEPGAPAIEDVLVARRSMHGRYGGMITLEDLSALLYYSAGVIAVKPLPGSSSGYPVRPHPSGGARYPIRLLMYCHAVAGLERGTYLYDPQTHSVDQLSATDLSSHLLMTSPWTIPGATPPKATGHIGAADCPLWIFPAADLTYQRLAYGLRSYRLIMMECGHIAQNLSLMATRLGKACIGLSGYMDDAVNQLMNVDGVNAAVLYVYLVGEIVAED